MRLAGRTALVTGASAGIGAEIARLLRRAGAEVVAHGRDPERTTAVAARIGATRVVADLATPDGVDALARQAGEIDILVLNAGAGHSGPFAAMDQQRIDDLLALDLAGAIRLTRLLLPGMLERGRGHLVVVSSIAGRTGVAGEAVYAAAKAGLDAFAESLRLELAGSGVGVSVVVPAVVDTGFFTARGRPYERQSPKPVSAEAVATAAVRAIERGSAEVYVPAWTRVAPTVRALAPSAFRRLSLRFGEEVRSR